MLFRNRMEMIKVGFESEINDGSPACEWNINRIAEMMQKMFVERLGICYRPLNEFESAMRVLFRALKDEVVKSEVDSSGNGLVKVTKLWSQESAETKLKERYGTTRPMVNLGDDGFSFYNRYDFDKDPMVFDAPVLF